MSAAHGGIPSYFFAVVVVRRGDSFLLVHERKHGELWYLPAGRVEPGESFFDAALRETLEETGLRIRLTGLVRVEHTPEPTCMRVRIVFAAEPVDDRAPRATPNEHTLGAAWVHPSELERYSLRGPDAQDLIRYVAEGGPIHPLSALAFEADPYR